MIKNAIQHLLSSNTYREFARHHAEQVQVGLEGGQNLPRHRLVQLLVVAHILFDLPEGRSGFQEPVAGEQLR